PDGPTVTLGLVQLDVIGKRSLGEALRKVGLELGEDLVGERSLAVERGNYQADAQLAPPLLRGNAAHRLDELGATVEGQVGERAGAAPSCRRQQNVDGGQP